jgi:hypothetical protein
MTVFKLQIPLAGSVPLAGSALMAYPRSGQPVLFIGPDRIAAQVLERIRRDCAATGKAYYECQFDPLGPDKNFKIGARVPDEPW